MTTRLLVSGIGQLVSATGVPGTGESSLAIATDQAVLVEAGVIKAIGANDSSFVAEARERGARELDIRGKVVIPGFVDSHTHLIHAGDRLEEFTKRMAGESYRPGGIWDTVAATRAASEEELRSALRHRLAQAHATGTTTIEVKTGYGLDVETELVLARVAAEVTDQVTFLGAHLVPPEFEEDPERYVDLVVGPMLEQIGEVARFIDVFYETGAFAASQTRRVLGAGVQAGLLPTLHASQLGPGEGVAIATEYGAVSLSHGTFLSDDDISRLARSDTTLTLLPGTEWATQQPYPDASRLLRAGVAVALASNCNPGSGYSSSMPFMVALAVREMGMSPADALYSATRAGATALRLSDRGALAPGMRADMVILDAPHYAYLAYRPGVPLVDQVILGGECV